MVVTGTLGQSLSMCSDSPADGDEPGSWDRVSSLGPWLVCHVDTAFGPRLQGPGRGLSVLTRGLASPEPGHPSHTPPGSPCSCAGHGTHRCSGGVSGVQAGHAAPQGVQGSCPCHTQAEGTLPSPAWFQTRTRTGAVHNDTRAPEQVTSTPVPRRAAPAPGRGLPAAPPLPHQGALSRNTPALPPTR